jgi:nucleoside-diphosphate-sugar epimerase
MKKIIVVGGAGFIGSNLVDELIKRGDKVVIIDDLSTGKKENINPEAEFHKLDARNLKKISPLFSGTDYVFQLAAFSNVQFSIDNPAESNDVNLNTTLNVLIAARDAGVKKVVYSASAAAYGNQKEDSWYEGMQADLLSPYGLQKYVGELYCGLFSKLYGLPTVALRYFNVYGKRQNLDGAYAPVVGIFVKKRLEGKPMTIFGDGKQTRDFISVADVVRANILAAENDKVAAGQVINIGSGRSYSVNELAKMVGGPIERKPPRVEVRKSLADNSLAKKLLGWKPTVDLAEWLDEQKREVGL